MKKKMKGMARARIPASLLALFLCSVISVSAQENRESWMPPEISGGRTSDGAGNFSPLDVTLTTLPKKTADAGKFTRDWLVDLNTFGIRNDGSEPDATAEGINAALQYAGEQGFNRILFPKGNYSIPADKPIVIRLKNTVIDLNGSTFRIVPNGETHYALIKIVRGAENLRLTNGTLVGDRNSHDYTTKKGVHDGGKGLFLVSGKELEIDHINFFDFTGDGVGSSSSGTETRPELLSRIFLRIYPKKHLESGAFDEQGRKIPSSEKTRSSSPINLKKFESEFEIGYLAGYQGFPFVTDRVFQVLFYDKDGNFLEKRSCLQYRKIQRPENAMYMNLELNQPEVGTQPLHSGAEANSWVLGINNFLPPVDVHFHHNTMRGNRRLGLALCGGQRWIIEHNEFSGNGGIPPAYGVDIEDGWELVYDIVFRDNRFRGNTGGSLVVCAGSELLFERNLFESTAEHVNRVVIYGRTFNYHFLNNIVRGGSVSFSTRTGIARIAGNTYENCSLKITFDAKGVADGLPRKNSSERVATPPLVLKNETLQHVAPLTGTYLSFEDSTLNHVRADASKATSLLSFVRCTFQDSTLQLPADRNTIRILMKENQGQLQELSPQSATPQQKGNKR